MAENNILISTHNPVTGPRHLGHYFGAMKSLVECQHDYETIVVLDDLLAHFMYPKERPYIQNRTFYVVQDFINSGFDAEKHTICLTSQLHRYFMEHLLYYSSVVDVAYCNHLYENSFLGSLKSYQRKELGIGNYPSVVEWLYPQIGISSITLGLKADYFQGGEEIIGYIYIMDEIVEKLNQKYGLQVAVPGYVPSKKGYVNGIDGKYMIQANCLFLSEAEPDLHQKVHQIQDKKVFIEWYESMHMEDKAADLSARPLQVNDKIDMANALLEELRPHRENKMTNGQIIEVLKKGNERAKELFSETAEELREVFYLPKL